MKRFVTCVYQSPNESDDEEEQFLQNFESTCSNIALENPIASFILGDLNAKSTNWWQPGGSNSCGLVLEDISAAFNYTQLIREPTNFDPGKAPSCIDHIFTTQPNLVIESGVIHSPMSTCHHQVVFSKVKFDYVRPPPYKRKVWHFNKAKVDLIGRSVKKYDWVRSFNRAWGGPAS